MADFIVMKQYVRILGIPGTQKEYLLIRATTEDGHDIAKGENITRAEAQKIIQEEGFEVALKNEDGIIWDTPDKDFLNTYKGRISIPQNLGY